MYLINAVRHIQHQSYLKVNLSSLDCLGTHTVSFREKTISSGYCKNKLVTMTDSTVEIETDGDMSCRDTCILGCRNLELSGQLLSPPPLSLILYVAALPMVKTGTQEG